MEIAAGSVVVYKLHRGANTRDVAAVEVPSIPDMSIISIPEDSSRGR
jgi:hypothetical protein